MKCSICKLQDHKHKLVFLYVLIFSFSIPFIYTDNGFISNFVIFVLPVRMSTTTASTRNWISRIQNISEKNYIIWSINNSSFPITCYHAKFLNIPNIDSLNHQFKFSNIHSSHHIFLINLMCLFLFLLLV